MSMGLGARCAVLSFASMLVAGSPGQAVEGGPSTLPVSPAAHQASAPEATAALAAPAHPQIKTQPQTKTQLGTKATPVDAIDPAALAAPGLVEAVIDVSEQRLTLSVDGVEQVEWLVSTGRKVHWTPTGEFTPTFLSRNHRSSRYDDAPMPYSVFFNGNIALHGTTYLKKLGSRASHGCVRLHPTNARTLFNLVRKAGKENTVIRVVD